MTIETIGRRVALYRKEAGFRTAEDLAVAIGNPAITKATIQNVESGRKADLSVSQLLDIAKVLDIPPVALVVPIDRPMDKVDIPGVGDAVSSMTNWELVRWFNSRQGGATTALHIWMQVVMAAIENLALSMERYKLAIMYYQTKNEVSAYTTTFGGKPQTFISDPRGDAEFALHEISAEAQKAYKTLKSTTSMDLSWAEGPWLTFGDADDPHTKATDVDG